MQPISRDTLKASGRNAGPVSARPEESIGLSAGFVTRRVRRVLRTTFGIVRPLHAGRMAGKVAAVVLLLAATGYMIAHETTGSGPVASATQMVGFKPARFMLSGNQAVKESEIERQLASQVDGSFFTLDARAMRDHLLVNPWLASVEVTKIYPDTLAIDVVERRPFAFWKSGDEFRVIARDGVVLGRASEEHLKLPQVVGSGANVAAPEFIATISRFPDLSSRSKAFVRVAERRWNLAFRNGVSVMLPEENWREALVELRRLQSVSGILDRNIVQLDMRLADRLTVKLEENTARERRDRLRESLERDWHKT